MYPVGIPALYAYILWSHRSELNPVLSQSKLAEAKADEGGHESFDSGVKRTLDRAALWEEEEMLRQKVLARKQNPDLVPSMFLWKDFGEYRQARVQTLSSSIEPVRDCCYVPRSRTTALPIAVLTQAPAAFPLENIGI